MKIQSFYFLSFLFLICLFQSPCKANDFPSTSEIRVIKNYNTYSFLDENGNISNIHFEQLGQKFSEGKNFAMFLDGTTGVIDIKGNILFKIKVEFDESGALAATNFSNGKAFIKESRKSGVVWHLIDDKGNILKDFNNISGLSYFYCGLIKVRVKEDSSWKWNYLDSNGNFISPINFDKADAFVDDKAKVTLGSEVYYIDTNGKRIMN